MLRLLLTAPTLSDSFLTGLTEVCEITTNNSNDNVWLNIANLALSELKAKPDEIAFIDECLRYAIMEGKQAFGKFYVRINAEGEMEFEWQVPEEQILHRPVSGLEAIQKGFKCRTMYGPTLLFHEIEYQAGHLAINDDWEKLAVERYNLPGLYFH